MVTGNDEFGMSVTYEDSDGTLDFVTSAHNFGAFFSGSPSHLDRFTFTADATGLTSAYDHRRHRHHHVPGRVMCSITDAVGIPLFGIPADSWVRVYQAPIQRVKHVNTRPNIEDVDSADYEKIWMVSPTDDYIESLYVIKETHVNGFRFRAADCGGGDIGFKTGECGGASWNRNVSEVYLDCDSSQDPPCRLEINLSSNHSAGLLSELGHPVHPRGRRRHLALDCHRWRW